jgi:cation-transporting P-type ATPase E
MNTNGLSSAEVAERVAAGQTNVAETKTSRSFSEIFRANVFTRFNAVLGALFVVVIFAGSIADGLFGFPLIANSAIGIIQEWIAKRKLDRLAFMHAPTATVIRDGAPIDIHTNDVVLGDLIVLRAGDQIPADGTVVDGTGLEVNEANLTGEMDAVPKDTDDQVMSGTIVTAGIGRFIAESVGTDAYVHRISAEAKVFTRAPSEIQNSINKLLKYITWILVFAAPLQIWSQFRLNEVENWRDSAIRAVGGLVGLVPEGLVLLTTLAFLSAALKLTREQVLVQELPAVEGLARVSVVCIDKTGTITTGNIVFEGIEILDGTDEPTVRAALGALADDPAANNTLTTIGDAIPPPKDWTTGALVPFDSSRKWKANAYEGRGTWYLGAPEMLASNNEALLAQVAAHADTGRRVILVAHSSTTTPTTDLPTDLSPVAIVLLLEEVRDDAAETLAYFREQGVRVIVISGDNPHTVGAIARVVGLEGHEPIDARTMGTTVEEISASLKRGNVFGRVSPEQKRTVVQALQEQGEVVAMTGDGVNDALALKRADIGIAMNNGAPATKAVAQLILLDGRFSHLPSVLAEGRRVIGNVERVANLFLAKNAMSLVAIIGAAVAGIQFPILPRHMTLISTVTIGIPAFILALGPNPRRYVPGLLKRVLSFAVPAGAIAGIAVVAANAVSDDDSGTGATMAALMSFFAILFILSRPLKGWKMGLLLSMIGLAVTAYVTPLGSNFFGFTHDVTLTANSAIVGGIAMVCISGVNRVRSRWLEEKPEGSSPN